MRQDKHVRMSPDQFAPFLFVTGKEKNMTISDIKIVKRILESNGRSEEIRIVLGYSFEDRFDGNKHYALFTDPRFDDLSNGDTPYCRNVTCLMANGILTFAGMKWMYEMATKSVDLSGCDLSDLTS